MNTPFTPHDGPFPGQHGPGFGFGPGERPGPHDRRRHGRREARNEVLDQIRAHRGGPFGPGGPGGPGFGRDFGGFGGPGFGFGPRGGRRRPGPRGGGRGKRGDVRAAILKLLTDRPMHGYEMIQEIAERSNDLWKPSPGSVYPTLQMLEDEGLIVTTQSDGSKKLFELTDDGKAAAEKIETAPWTEITEGADPVHVNLRAALGQLFGAVAQSANAANAEQQQRILDIVNNARREIYQILGES
ncbi:MAG TPA: PadR family transcriptional regulator [Mycobacterium sp.]